MDESDITGLIKVGFLVLVGIAALIVFLRHSAWKEGRVEKAKKWPRTEATVQSAEMESVRHGRYSDIVLPCFAFSYAVAGEYYSGRFALNAAGDTADTLIKTLPNRKLDVHYDPREPAVYYLPYETLNGCEVEQKISTNMVKLYPSD